MKKLFTLAIIIFICFPAKAKIIYVRGAATGVNNGTSWSNAYTNLNAALSTTKGDTVWVANGTYRGANTLYDSTKLFGGFTGTETSLAQRVLGSYQTVLDGDSGILGNRYDNARVILLSKSVTASGINCVIDGFKIANGFNINAVGAGVCIDQGSLSLINVDIANCFFYNNESLIGGSAVGIMTRGTTTISNCRFEHNQTTGFTTSCGGAISKGMGQLTSMSVAGPLYISGCIFKDNTAVLGGAIYTRDTSITSISRCVFIGNLASAGGAIYDCRSANLQVYSSLIAGNKAIAGGAQYSDSTTPYRPHSFIHCTIAGNQSSGTRSSNYTISLGKSGDVLRNSIIWGNTSNGSVSPHIANPPAGALYQYNVIQGGGGLPNTTGTYTFNPMFVLPGNASTAPFPVTSSYNYHLSALSDAVDTGMNMGLIAPHNLDLDSNARVQGRLPDLGAYEWKSCPWLNVAVSGPTAFCLPGSVTLTASANPFYNYTYQWNGGAQTGATITVATSGMNKVVVVDSMGCRSSAGVMVNAVPIPNPAITYTAGNTLSVPAIYATYQWYLNGSPISGATGATYNPTTNGNYTVRVTTNPGNCIGTSAVYQLRNLEVGGALMENNVLVYPNPGDGRLFIALEGLQGMAEVAVAVRSVTGQEIVRKLYHAAGGSFSEQLDISSAARGIYFVSIIANGGQIVRRIVVE